MKELTYINILLLLGATAVGGSWPPQRSASTDPYFFPSPSIHPLIPILLRSVITSSSHLILGTYINMHILIHSLSSHDIYLLTSTDAFIYIIPLEVHNVIADAAMPTGT